MVKMRIKQLREARGWNQGDLSTASGIHSGIISRYENNNTQRVTLDSLQAIADALGVSVSELFEEKETA